MRDCVCVSVRVHVEPTTSAKHNKGDEKNMMGLAHSRASRKRRVTNKKMGRCVSLSKPVTMCGIMRVGLCVFDR